MALTGLSPRQGVSFHSKCAQQTFVLSGRLAIGRRYKVRQQSESIRDRCNPCCDARPGASEPGRDPSLPPNVPRAKPAPSWNPFKDTKKEVSTCHSSCHCFCLKPRKVSFNTTVASRAYVLYRTQQEQHCRTCSKTREIS